MISVLILTLDEEVNLPSCLESVSWSDDIVVLDSLSRDRTREIALAAGARVLDRPFDDELSHRTYSIRNIAFKYPWVYNPDADEVTTPELRDEMLRVVSEPDRREVAYRMRFKTIFMGRWIRRSSLYPTWVMRLFRPDRIRFERRTNLRYVADGPEGRLDGHFLHYTFRKGMDAWMEKHRRYAAAEAREAVDVLKGGWLDWRGLMSLSDPVKHRRALKDLAFRLPFRPALRFLYMYLMRMGFADGVPGYRYCRLLSLYERMIDIEVARLRKSMRQETPGGGREGAGEAGGNRRAGVLPVLTVKKTSKSG